MELRRILYGYKKEQFEYQIEPHEAEIVKGIFNDYVSGKTLLAIAEDLTLNNVVYFKDKTVWTKNAVKRILENTHYMGDAEYPKIIEKETFLNAEKVKLGKGGGNRPTDTEENKYLKQYCVCNKCGKRFTRKAKHKLRERWYCSNGCSYTEKYLDDKELKNMIYTVFSKIKAMPEILNIDEEKTVDLPQELLRKDRNIKNLMLQPDASFMPVKKLLFDFVKQEFDTMQSEFSLGITSELTRYICETEIIQDCLDVEFMKNTVSKIIVLSDGNINVRFINGKEISNTSEELK